MAALFECPLVQFLYDWQTLIAGVLALAAASVGSFLLWRQIHASERQEVERRRRRFRAARSTLSLSLSALTDYIVEAGRRLASIHHAAGQHAGGTNPLGFTAPRLPSEITQAFERIVEASESDELGDKVHAILSDLQTFQARIREFENLPAHRVGIQRNVEDYILQAARLYRNVTELFPFARGHDEEQERGTYMGALRFGFDLDELQFADLYRRANELDAAQQ